MTAHLIGEKLPDDPYMAVVEMLHGIDRSMVKKVVTECFGATDKRQLGRMKGQFYKRHRGGSKDKYAAILTALAERYPWTNDVFFCDVGAHLQYLEGEIALRMMAWARAHDIPLIPVHDAYAVPIEYERPTEQAMEMAWSVVMDNAKSDGTLLQKARERAPLMYVSK